MRLMDRLFKRLFEKYDLEYEVIGIRPGENLSSAARARREEMLVNAERIIRDNTGVTPTRVSSSTDCNIPLSLGIPALCFGNYLGHGAHTREEYILRSSLRPGYEVAFETVLRYVDL